MVGQAGPHDLAMSERRLFVDGKPVLEDGYVVSGLDLGFLRGLSVFETLRTSNGRFFRADQHLRRLAASAAALGVPCPSLSTLRLDLRLAVVGWSGDARVQLTLTEGGRRLLCVEPLDLSGIGRPLRVATRTWEAPEWLDGRVKHTSRAFSRAAVAASGADEVLWKTRAGLLTEGTRSNLFAVVDGVFVTPPDDGQLLAGVTRAALLEVAAKIGVAVEERDLPVHTLAVDDGVDELYASSTVKHLAPIVEVDGEPAPGAGPVGASVSQAFEALVATECHGGS